VASDRDILRNAARNALKMMRDSGFEISDKLEVVVDPELPFMGYSTQRSGGHVIVVSGMALKSGLVEALLIHEMSHVYRTITKHPSHDHELLNRVTHAIMHKNQMTEDYQIKTIQQAVNHIQDLYADDVAFKVFEKSKSLPLNQIGNFFLSWIKDKPIDPKGTREKWLNVSLMLNNCFAISIMKRHNIKDIDNQAENMVQKFLFKTNNTMKKEFEHFKDFMTNLKEDPTELKFKKDLTKYLTKIVELTK